MAQEVKTWEWDVRQPLIAKYIKDLIEERYVIGQIFPVCVSKEVRIQEAVVLVEKIHINPTLKNETRD